MTINEQIRSLCSRLRLYALPRLLESEAHLAQEQGKTHVEFLHDLLAREVQERDSKDFQRRLKAAALPARHDLDLFDHNYSQGITAPRLRDLRRLGWLEQNYNLILMGPSGTGKLPTRHQQSGQKHWMMKYSLPLYLTDYYITAR
nr:ATP-binding protein [Parabacteroides goldsteinii]